MSLRNAATMILATLSLGGALGCQPLARVYHQAGQPNAIARRNAGARIPSRAPSERTPSVILAADFADPPARAAQPNDEPLKSDEEKKKEETAKPAPGYTAPSEAIRQLILVTAVATTPGSASGGGSVGKEFAEANAGLAGAPGLAAPTVSAQATGVIGPPGLQEGTATALGPIAPNSLFQPARNSLSGVNGGCAALVRGGFFQGSDASCRTFFNLGPRARLNHGTSKFARR